MKNSLSIGSFTKGALSLVGWGIAKSAGLSCKRQSRRPNIGVLVIKVRAHDSVSALTTELSNLRILENDHIGGDATLLPVMLANI